MSTGQLHTFVVLSRSQRTFVQASVTAGAPHAYSSDVQGNGDNWIYDLGVSRFAERASQSVH
jgi:hypothetical protein